jgi:hypothetical protein
VNLLVKQSSIFIAMIVKVSKTHYQFVFDVLVTHLQMLSKVEAPLV